MTASNGVTVTLPADVNMVDETGFVWSFLHEASDPSRMYPGALIVAGDPIEPFLARSSTSSTAPATSRSSTSRSSACPRTWSTSSATRTSCRTSENLKPPALAPPPILPPSCSTPSPASR